MRLNTSKEKLKECLLSILMTKRIQEISIKELCNKAGIHRSTFYDNYETIYDLYYQIHRDSFEKIINIIGNKVKEGKVGIEEVEKVIELYEKDEVLNFLLTKANTDELFMVYILQYYENRYSILKDDFLTYTRFRSGTVGGVLAIQDWLKRGKPCSKKELAEIIIGE